MLKSYMERFIPLIEADVQALLTPAENYPPLFYRMLQYHMGWVDAEGKPTHDGGGKRIRPFLSMLVCEAICGKADQARPAAAAVELLHNFSLLHDDVQDGSPLRRNRETVWKVWGVKQAINAGDVMFTLAHLAIPRLTLEANLHLAYEMVRALDDACLELTRGQHLDMLFEERDEVSADEYLDMISGKTAALVATAARLGAMAGSADPGLQANYEAFGFNLGMAFQVRDDMLDIWGSPEQTGKAAAVDIYDRKKSLPVLYALERSEELRAFYRREADFDDQAVSRIIGLLDQVGAKDYARSLAESYSHGTVQYLEAASPGGDAGDALVELVEEMLKRKG